MKKKILFLIIIFSVALTAQSGMNDTGKSETYNLNLEDAIRIALEKNKDILISNADVRKAEAQVSEAWGNALPTLNFSASYTRNIELPVLFIPPNTPFNPSPNTLKFQLGANNSYTAALTLSQVLFSVKVNTAIQIAEKFSNYTNHNDQAKKEEIIYSVKKTFYGVLLTQKVVEVTEEGYKLAKANYDKLALLFKQGMCSEYDLLRAEVQVAKTEPMLIQAKNSTVLAKNGLKNLLGLELNTEINVIGSLEMDEMPDELLKAGEMLAMEKNSTLQSLNAYEEILEKNISIERADYFPTLAAFGNVQYQSQDNTFKFKDYNWARSTMVGLQLSYPVFRGLQTVYRTEQAKIEKEKVTITKDKLKEGIKIQIEDARLRMKEARQRMDAQIKSVEQATKAAEIAEVRFKNGVGTQLELIDAQVAITQTKTSKAQAVYDYLIAKADWEKITGSYQKLTENNK